MLDQAMRLEAKGVGGTSTRAGVPTQRVWDKAMVARLWLRHLFTGSVIVVPLRCLYKMLLCQDQYSPSESAMPLCPTFSQ